jgi:hypothetical protein
MGQIRGSPRTRIPASPHVAKVNEAVLVDDRARFEADPERSERIQLMIPGEARVGLPPDGYVWVARMGALRGGYAPLRVRTRSGGGDPAHG